MADIAAVVVRRAVALSMALATLAAAPVELAWTTQPAAAQQSDWGGFFSPFSPAPRHRQQPPTEWNQQYWWGPPQHAPQYEQRREVDYSHAPPPRKQDTTAAKHIIVMGDAMADWLAYGLEDAVSDTPDIAVVRKNRANSGLIRSESRNAYDWPQAARDILANDQPAFIVMMLGMSDRQSIRERQQRPNPASPPANANPAATAPNAPNPEHPDQATSHPPTEEDAQSTAEESPTSSPEAGRGRTVTYEFRSEQWATAYTKRIDEMIGVLKSKGVPVLWVGLPSFRGSHAAADAAYLNDLYRDRAGKAGITYVDVWDGFVDENGNFSMQGPDFEGQVRRLRSADGMYFTKAGAQKLAHYAAREIRRAMTTQGTPVATPAPEEPQSQGAAEPGARAARPLAGPVVPLTGPPSASEGLMGGAPARSPGNDSTAARFLVKGEPLTPAVGRADDFAWPRNQGLPQLNDAEDKRSDTPPAQKPDSKSADKSEGKPTEKSEGKPVEKSDARPDAKPGQKSENRPAEKVDGSAPSKGPAGAGSAKRAGTLPPRARRAPRVAEQPPRSSPPVVEQPPQPSGSPAADDGLRPPGTIPGR